jgi:hypothetical protein
VRILLINGDRDETQIEKAISVISVFAPTSVCLAEHGKETLFAFENKETIV